MDRQLHHCVLTRRETLVLAGGAYLINATGCSAAASDPNMPAVGEVPDVGLFTGADRAPIPASVPMVRTSGWSWHGRGAALYQEDPSFVAALHPRAGFRAADGRLFRLADKQSLFVEMFGAAGDLRLDVKGNVASGTNDTQAFAAAGRWIQYANGGTLHCSRNAAYLVGEQQFRAPDRNPDGQVTGVFAWAGQPIFRVWGASGHIAVEGNGALLKAVPGYRYGVFDADTGTPKASRAPYTATAGELGFPYLGMIELQHCTGGYSVRNLQLDGSADQLVLGGEHGDLGRQVNGCGLYTINNKGPIAIENLTIHHQPWDGWLLRHDGPVSDGSERANIIGFHGHHNGRQALSLTGGEGGRVADSTFLLSGRDIGFASAPAAGLDIEAEGFPVRNWSFVNCQFGGSTGVALLASVNDAADLRFRRCAIHGAYEIALWPGKPGMQFEECLVTGMTTAVHSGTSFSRCLFTDDTRQSPFGQVHFGQDKILLNLANAAGAQIDECIVTRQSPGIALYCDQQTAQFRTCTIHARLGGGVNVLWGTWSGRSQVTTGPASRNQAINAYFTHLAPGSSLLIDGQPL